MSTIKVQKVCESSMNNLIKNQWGQLKFRVGTPLLKVSEIRIDNNLDLTFDTETAEQIALITENERTQLSYSMKYKKWYMIYHYNASNAWIARIVSLIYEGNKPAKEIIEMSRTYCPFF